MICCKDSRASTMQQVCLLAYFLLMVICFISLLAPLLYSQMLTNAIVGVYIILIVWNLLLLMRFLTIDAKDLKIMKLEDNYVDKKRQLGICHFGTILYQMAICWYPSDQFSHVDMPNESKESLVFCTVCKAEVGSLSKHCKACNMCIEGFDHHCWVCR